MNPVSAPRLEDIPDLGQRAQAALELDAQGGQAAYGQMSVILTTLSEAQRLDPFDLNLVRREFNILAPSLNSPDELRFFYDDLLAVHSMDERLFRHWLLPSAAVLIDLTLPRSAARLLEMAPVCYRRGPDWARIDQALSLAGIRRGLPRAEWPVYEGVAWPRMDRYSLQTPLESPREIRYGDQLPYWAV